MEAASNVGPRSNVRLWSIYGVVVQFGDCPAEMLLPSYPAISTIKSGKSWEGEKDEQLEG